MPIVPEKEVQKRIASLKRQRGIMLIEGFIAATEKGLIQWRQLPMTEAGDRAKVVADVPLAKDEDDGEIRLGVRLSMDLDPARVPVLQIRPLRGSVLPSPAVDYSPGDMGSAYDGLQRLRETACAVATLDLLDGDNCAAFEGINRNLNALLRVREG